jgi:hypothetical protein
MDMYEKSAIRELNKKLATVNKFDLGALTLNRQGILAPSQMKIIRKRLLWTGAILLAIVGFIIYQYLKSGMPELGTKTYMYIGVILLTFFVVGRGFIIALKNASQRKVESMDGVGVAVYTTSTDHDTGDENTTYYYNICNTRFMVHSRDAYYALVNELKYRAYYLPGSKVLVNIEALEAPSSKTLI